MNVTMYVDFTNCIIDMLNAYVLVRLPFDIIISYIFCQGFVVDVGSNDFC